MDKYKKTTNITGFTLVELIVVIVILAILATIAFLSFSSQSSSARDSTRLSDISNISKGLGVLDATSGKFPLPDKNAKLLSGSTIIGYQGYAGETVLKMIKLSNGGKDPKTGAYYTYNTNFNQSKHQILGFLENNNFVTLDVFSDFKAYADHEEEQYPYTKGDVLGIILAQSGVEFIPLQETSTGIDLTQNNIGYASVYNNTGIQTSPSYTTIQTYTQTGEVSVIPRGLTINNPGLGCKDILNSGINIDGKYYINPTGSETISVFCDMTTDGGGWTLILYGNSSENATSILNTDSVNLEQSTSTGHTFKLSDTTINSISGNYRAKSEIYGFTAFWKSSCTWLGTNYTNDRSEDCETSYDNTNWESPQSTVEPVASRTEGGITNYSYGADVALQKNSFDVGGHQNGWYMHKADGTYCDGVYYGEGCNISVWKK